MLRVESIVCFIEAKLGEPWRRQNHVQERGRQARREERLLDMIERNAAASERLAVTIENLANTPERDVRRA